MHSTQQQHLFVSVCVSQRDSIPSGGRNTPHGLLLPLLLTLALRSYRLARRSPMMRCLRHETSPATSADAMRCFIFLGEGEEDLLQICCRSQFFYLPVNMWERGAAELLFVSLTRRQGALHCFLCLCVFQGLHLHSNPCQLSRGSSSLNATLDTPRPFLML